MRQNLEQYVILLFAGTADCDEIRQEILQNTLDHYDDLISQGVAPEAAYCQAISGIGDLSEILTASGQEISLQPYKSSADEEQPASRKLFTTIAVAMYILCPLPVLLLQNVAGVCLLLVMVAAATGLLIVVERNKPDEKEDRQEGTPKHKLQKSVSSLISTLGVAVYFIVSFATGAWYITWVIFPLTAAVKGLVHACLDLKEEI